MLSINMNGKNKLNTSQITRLIRDSCDPITKKILINQNNIRSYLYVTRTGVGPIKTKYGEFWLFTFMIKDYWKDYEVLIKVDSLKDFDPIFKNKEILLRIDSGCCTGQVYGDLTCECEPQLKTAMKEITEFGEGIIIHIPSQEGRGFGLSFKLATLFTQKYLGYNTIDSFRLMNSSNLLDKRTYEGVIGILKFLNIEERVKIKLMTNNPDKMTLLEENKFSIIRKAIIIKPNKYTSRNLAAKKKYLKHII
ncbi:MAG: GTP cyclohydrolase II [Patescibacteria group bacterium]